MAEEQFVQMYVRDFSALAARSEAGVDVEPQLRRRVSETRSHAALMDLRKTVGHLTAVSERLRVKSRRDATQAVKNTPDPVAAAARRQAFLLRVADLLEAEPDEPQRRGTALSRV